MNNPVRWVELEDGLLSAFFGFDERNRSNEDVPVMKMTRRLMVSPPRPHEVGASDERKTLWSWLARDSEGIRGQGFVGRVEEAKAQAEDVAEKLGWVQADRSAKPPISADARQG